MYVYIYIYIHVYIYTFIYVYIHIYVYIIHIHIYVYIYIHIFIQHNLWVKKHITIITANYLELIGKMPFVSEFMRPRAVFKIKLQLSMHFFKKVIK